MTTEETKAGEAKAKEAAGEVRASTARRMEERKGEIRESAERCVDDVLSDEAGAGFAKSVMKIVRRAEEFAAGNPWARGVFILAAADHLGKQCGCDVPCEPCEGSGP